jgi:hypothetical protein
MQSVSNPASAGNSATAGHLPRYWTSRDLADLGRRPADVRRRCPWAVERVGLAGERVWDAEDLETLGRDPA